MKHFRITYKVMDRFNPEFNEINKMSCQAKDEDEARNKVLNAAYEITDFTYPRIRIMDSQAL